MIIISFIDQTFTVFGNTIMYEFLVFDCFYIVSVVQVFKILLKEVFMNFFTAKWIEKTLICKK